MAVVKTVVHDPYSDGLGKGSQLGVAFLRKVSVDLNTAATTVTLSPSDVGATSFYGIMSIVMLTTGTAYVSTVSATAPVITATANTCKFDVYILCRGM